MIFLNCGKQDLFYFQKWEILKLKGTYLIQNRLFEIQFVNKKVKIKILVIYNINKYLKFLNFLKTKIIILFS